MSSSFYSQLQVFQLIFKGDSAEGNKDSLFSWYPKGWNEILTSTWVKFRISQTVFWNLSITLSILALEPPRQLLWSILRSKYNSFKITWMIKFLWLWLSLFCACLMFKNLFTLYNAIGASRPISQEPMNQSFRLYIFKRFSSTNSPRLPYSEQ